MKPKPNIDIDEEVSTCDPSCPFLVPFNHPYYSHSAFCSHLKKDLSWHDYWLSDCIREKTNEIAEGRNERA